MAKSLLDGVFRFKNAASPILIWKPADGSTPIVVVCHFTSHYVTSRLIKYTKNGHHRVQALNNLQEDLKTLSRIASGDTAVSLQDVVLDAEDFDQGLLRLAEYKDLIQGESVQGRVPLLYPCIELKGSTFDDYRIQVARRNTDDVTTRPDYYSDTFRLIDEQFPDR